MTTIAQTLRPGAESAQSGRQAARCDPRGHSRLTGWPETGRDNEISELDGALILVASRLTASGLTILPLPSANIFTTILR